MALSFGVAAGTRGSAAETPPDFTAKPAAKAEGDAVCLAFAVSMPTDVTVDILDKDGRIVGEYKATGFVPLCYEEFLRRGC